MKKGKNREKTITGIVIPAEWDEDDNVTGVAIETEDGEQYQVEPNEKGDELLAFSGYEIEATGSIRERRDGAMMISVNEYESLGVYEDEYDDELVSNDEEYEEREDDDDPW
jgi:hypothetical protein